MMGEGKGMGREEMDVKLRYQTMGSEDCHGVKHTLYCMHIHVHVYMLIKIWTVLKPLDSYKMNRMVM